MPTHTDVRKTTPGARPFDNSLGTLSRTLHASLPSREDTERILNAKPYPSVLVHEIMTTPYSTLLDEGHEQHETPANIPTSNTHPVSIARHMLLLVSLLQHLHPDFHEDSRRLSEPPSAMAQRLLDLAINTVTTQNSLLGSVEALECIIMESVSHANVGNLRQSWLASRRALSTAQLMGLHKSRNHAQLPKLDAKTNFNPQMMWFRIVFLDRFLCLLLGLPQGCTDRSMTPDAIMTKDLPMHAIERVHCAVASQILERNEAGPAPEDINFTRNLDHELQKAGRSLPSKWWAIPRSAPLDSYGLMRDTRRMYAQVLHYNLLNQLHLPYLLRTASPEGRYEYSRFTCVNSSREILTRFMALRQFNGIAYSCRIIDFIALMASMTLLLAHLAAQDSPEGNVLAHQYQSDRAMIEQVEENMRDNRISRDALSIQSAEMLRRLLAIEPSSEDPDLNHESVSVDGAEDVNESSNNDDGFRVHIPYFGMIRIARRGMSREPASAGTAFSPDGGAIIGAHPHSAARTVPRGYSVGFDGTPCTDQSIFDNRTSNTGVNSGLAGNPLAPQRGTDFSDPFLQPQDYPGLAAGNDDWVFQGVDGAFFDNLMKNAAMEGNTMSFFDSLMKSAGQDGGAGSHSNANTIDMTG